MYTRYLKVIILLLISGTLYAQNLLIHCGSLIDGVNNQPMNNKTIILKDDRILRIEDGFTAPSSGDSLIDLSDYTVLPGLMDMHVHLEGESNPDSYLERFTKSKTEIAFESTVYARRTLMAGFTTVRDVGGRGINIALRDAINSGIVMGPRIFTSGKSIATTGGHADPTNGMRDDLMGDPGPKEGVINGPADAAKAVRQRYKNGADLIKITATGGVLSVAKDGKRPQFSQEELEAIIKTARDYNMHTAAHAHGAEGMKRAVLAGITSIEHGTMMTEEVMDLMIEQGTYYVPTISAGKFVAEKAKVEGYYPELVVPKAREIGPLIQNTFAKAYRKGVKIAFGTDAGVPYHGDNAEEFIYMVEAGMKPMEAIKSATMVSAQLVGMEDELGSIEAGKIADIVALKGDPLEDISLMREIKFVMKAGKVYLSR